MEKKKYDVYMVNNLIYGDGRVETDESYVGSTWATSQKKAISNLKFRLGYKPSDLICDWNYGGYRRTTFKAIEV